MNRFQLVMGLICLVLAVVILIFADGLRRWYSGGFFLLLGVVMLLGARAHATGAADAAPPGQEDASSGTH